MNEPSPIRRKPRPPVDAPPAPTEYPEIAAGLARIIDVKTLMVKDEALTDRQREYAHLIAPEFFPGGINPFRTEGKDYSYVTDLNLKEDLYFLHPLMDPSVLEVGAVRRFPAGVNENYITEKYEEDKWVSEGNNQLALAVEAYIEENLEGFKAQEKIHLLSVGPCGGDITTLFALRAFARKGLLEKVHVAMVDIVPNVLEATMLGKFKVPPAMIEEYGLKYAGEAGEEYKKLLAQGVLHGVKEWYANLHNEKNDMSDEALAASAANEASAAEPRVQYYRGDGEQLPAELQGKFDVVLSAYVHHHMQLRARRALCGQMEQAATQGGFLGVVDFYEPTFEDYMSWYKPHFEKHGTPPPVECPVTDGNFLAKFFQKSIIKKVDNTLRNSLLVTGEKR